jgi:hypothetical protein
VPAAHRRLRVVYYPLGGDPQIRDVPATHQALSELVGGTLDTVALPAGLVALVRESADAAGLPLNRVSPSRLGCSYPLHGPFVVAKLGHAAGDDPSGASLVSLTDDDAARALEVFPPRRPPQRRRPPGVTTP